MDGNNDPNKQRSQELLASLKNVEISAPAFSETKILAIGLERRARQRSLRWWRFLSIASASVAAISLLVISFLLNRPDFEVSAGKAVVVKVETLSVQQEQIAFVEVELPEGVQFYTKRYPEMRDQKVVRVPWNQGRFKEHFSFVIKGKEKGIKTLKVTFLDQNSNVVEEERVKISFDHEGRHV